MPNNTFVYKQKLLTSVNTIQICVQSFLYNLDVLIFTQNEINLRPPNKNDQQNIDQLVVSRFILDMFSRFSSTQAPNLHGVRNKNFRRNRIRKTNKETDI